MVTSLRLGRWLPSWPAFRPDLSRETAWLDGVRGLAAFLVMSNHFGFEFLTEIVSAPFGAELLVDFNHDGVYYYTKGTRLWEPWRLPFLRLLVCAGDGQVAIFFVLSGFVLSWGPLKKIRADNYDKLAQTLGSSVIRRWFRLYLPCIAVSSLSMLDIIIRQDHTLWTAVKEIWTFTMESVRWSQPYVIGYQFSILAVHRYNYVMWTIPFEWGGSVFIYIMMLALGRIASYPRRTCIFLLVALHACHEAYWPMWLFASGLLLADYVQQVGGFSQLTQRTSRRASVSWSILLIIGLYLLGFDLASDTVTTPGYSWLEDLPIPSAYSLGTKSGRFWWAWGGILTVVSSSHLSYVRALFESRHIQYLGKISFMLYLIHVLLAIAIGHPIRNYLYGAFATKEHNSALNADVFITTPLMNFTIYAILWSVCAVFSMTVAHFLEIYVDRPCTKIGKIVDDLLLNGISAKPSRIREEEPVSGSIEEEHLLSSVEAEVAETQEA